MSGHSRDEELPMTGNGHGQRTGANYPTGARVNRYANTNRVYDGTCSKECKDTWSSPFWWLPMIGSWFLTAAAIMSLLEFMGYRIMSSRNWEFGYSTLLAVEAILFIVYAALWGAGKCKSETRKNAPAQYYFPGAGFLLAATVTGGIGVMLMGVFRLQWTGAILDTFDITNNALAPLWYNPDGTIADLLPVNMQWIAFMVAMTVTSWSTLFGYMMVFREEMSDYD